LDNVIYRLGFAMVHTGSQTACYARPFYGQWTQVNIPSFPCKARTGYLDKGVQQKS
jgi:hypothetical protein